MSRRDWPWFALAVLGLLCSLAGAETRLEWVPPLLLDSSGDPSASPDTLRAHGGTVLRWGSNDYLIYAGNMELYRHRLDPAGPSPRSGSHFGVPAYGDRDLNLFNFAVCDDCRYGAAGFDVQGLVLWDMGQGTSPLFGDSRRWMDSGTAGAFTFSYGTRQYLIARVHPDCQGDALVEITGIRPEHQRLVQCITNGAGQPYTVDGGFWIDKPLIPGDPITGWVWLCDRAYGPRVHAYTVRTVGTDPWLDAVGWTIRAAWVLDHYLDVDAEHMVAVSAYSTGLSVWDITDPAAPALRSLTPLPFMVTAHSVELRWPYVYVGTINTVDTGSGHLFDITNPAAPVEVDPAFWTADPPPCQTGSVVPPDSPYPWNDYPCEANRGGAWHGDWLYLSRSSVVERFRLIVAPAIQPIFADGFESGDTGAWR